MYEGLCMNFKVQIADRRLELVIKNVIFDIGNVLVDFGWKEYLACLGFDGAMIKRIAKASVGGPYWDEFDRGAISEEETIKHFIEADPEIENELHRAFDSIVGMITKRDDAIPWVKSLKDAGYNVYYLSNFSKKAYDECRDTLGFMEHMDGGIMSFRELVVKPNPEIYTRLLERYNLVAEECVFIDDTERNVVVARELGFNGVVHVSGEETRKELEKLGVNY